MGFWPFGREPADVETASRVVSAPTRDSRRVRAKLTLHFEDPQTQAAADEAADRCAHLAEAMFQEAPDHEHLLGNEPGLTAALQQRLPPGLPALRSVEIAALHVLGDPGSNLRRKSTTPPPGGIGDFRLPVAGPPPSGLTPPPPSGAYPPSSGGTYRPPSVSYPAEAPPSAGLRGSSPSSNPPPPHAHPPPSGLVPPPGSVRAPPLSQPLSSKRRSVSSSLRAMTPALIPPRGSPPAEIGAALAPLLRDAATRLLVGALRTHDLVMVRRVPLDEAAAELLSALLPVSEAPPGEFEASRIMEITRWRGTLGPEIMEALRAECAALAAYLTGVALAQVGVVHGLADELVGALSHAAFGGGSDGHGWPSPATGGFSQENLVADAAARVARALHHPGVGQLDIALAPLLDAVAADVTLIAQMAKLSLGLSSA